MNSPKLKTIGLFLFSLICLVLICSNTVLARKIRDDNIHSKIYFKEASNNWSSFSNSLEQFELKYIKGAIKNSLGKKMFIFPVLEKVFNRNIDIKEINKIEIEKINEGSLYGVFKVKVILNNSERNCFVLNVSKSLSINKLLQSEFNNLKKLYQINSKYAPEIFAFTSGKAITDRGDIKVAMFAVEFIEGIPLAVVDETHIFPKSREMQNKRNAPTVVFDEELSSLIKKEMIKIQTIYYIKNEQLAISHVAPGTKTVEMGSYINKGDFMLKKEGKNHIKLTSVRKLKYKSIPVFIQKLLTHKEYNYETVGELVNKKEINNVFTPWEVFAGIKMALEDVYGSEKGLKEFESWLEQYKAAVENGKFDNRFIEELNVFLVNIRS